MAQARALEACAAGRGRGRDHVRPPRAAGPRGRPPDGPDLLHLRGRLRLRDRRRDDAADRRDGARRGRHDLRADRGPRHPASCSSSTSRAGSSTTRPGTTAACSRTSSAARSTSTRPTRCSASTATTTCACSTTARSARPMAAIEGRTHAYHLVPRVVSKAGAVAAHARARGYDLGGVHRGRRLGRGPRGRRLGRPLLRRRQRPRARPRPARLPAQLGQRHGHRGQHGRRLLRGGRLDPGRASLSSSTSDRSR